MKKILSVLLCMTAMSLMLISCGGKETSTADAGASKEEAVSIYMFISSPEYAESIGELIKAYKEVKPNVTINYETTQNDYPTLLKAKLNSGEAPDIFASTSGKEIGVYLDYSADLTAQPLADAMSDAVKSVMMSGDEVHGMSIKGNFFGLVYNKGIFEEVGIDFPQTFDELESACAAIEAAGYQPFSSGFAEWWVFKHLFQHFLNAAQPDDVEGLINSFITGEAKIADYPELYDDFFKFVDLVVKYGDRKPLESDLSTEIAALGTGKAAMIIGQGAWVEADVLKIDPSLKIGFDGYPLSSDPADSRVIAGSDQAIRIYKDSPVLDDVLDFANWWYTSDYGKSWFSDVAGVIPPIDDAKTPDFEIIKQGNAHVAEEGAGTLAVAYSTDSFHQAFGEIMQSYVAGVKTKDEACADIELKWVALEGK